MLKVTVAASDASGPVNEDVVGSHGAAVWVIDGATGIGASLLECQSDAAWLAQRADRELQALLTATPEMPTVDLLGRVMSACRDAFFEQWVGDDHGTHLHPSAAFAMVRQIGGDVEFSTLGDCRIAYRLDGTAQLFGTSGLAEVEARTLELTRRCLQKDPDITPEALRDRLLPQLRANRRLMNQPDGYWVLGTEPAAAFHLDRLVVPARVGETFALASDGFLRLIEVFGAASPDDFLAMDDDAKFRRALRMLRDLEGEERSSHRYPRVKVHDDATFAQCCVVEEG
jgi:hypothetical protein